MAFLEIPNMVISVQCPMTKMTSSPFSINSTDHEVENIAKTKVSKDINIELQAVLDGFRDYFSFYFFI
jgi:hypothetical protein